MPTRPLSNAARSTTHANKRAREEIGFLDWNATSLTGLFDWKFRDFITPSIVSSLYTSHLIFATLALTGLALANYWLLFRSPARGEPYFYLTLVGLDISAVLIMLVWTLVVRLCLEAIMVIFRGEEHLRELVDRARSKEN
jgi:hypothetical protein